MGGCRCVYKNCKKISDSVTHFFHFPVFDKQRCHKWIMNAQRPDLLNLTLSQLKNRVLCQNHFTDDMFMNYMKKSLRHNAVPVPYESSSTEKELYLDDEMEALKQTEIQSKGEDDSKFFTSREKIATLSFPYNQFLIQCNYENINDPSLNKSLPISKKTSLNTPTIVPIQYNNENSNQVPTDKPPQKIEDIIKRRSARHIKDKAPDIPVLLETKNPTLVGTQVQLQGTLKGPGTNLNKIEKELIEKRHKKVKVPNVIILSEQRNPLPQMLKETDTNIQQAEKELSKENNVQMQQTQKEAIIAGLDEIQQNVMNINVNNDCIVAYPDYTIVLPEETPQQQIQNIAQKESTTAIETSNQPDKEAMIDLPKELLFNKRKKKSHKQRTSPPYIEKRKHKCRSPRKMSSLSVALLHKVNENSKDIAEIKNLLLRQNRGSYLPNKTSQKLSGCELEIRKKFLFDEISQYLSSNLKNDLYEELFLNIRINTSKVI